MFVDNDRCALRLRPQLNLRSSLTLTVITKKGAQMYTIGEVAQRFGLSISTLRYYDQQGFFPKLRRHGGIRHFTEHELETLRVIECLKKSGLSIKAIQQFMHWCELGSESYPQRKALFEAQKARVQAEMEHLQKVMAMLEFKCWYYEKAMADGHETHIQSLLPKGLPPDIQALYDQAHS